MAERTRVFVYEYLSGGGVAAVDPTDEDARTLLAAGRAMRDALVTDLASRSDLAVTCAGDCTSTPGVRSAAPRAGETALAFVTREARRHDAVFVVAPETQGVLAALRRAVDDERWLGASLAAIELAASKRATCEHLHACGIATPRRWRSTRAGAGEEAPPSFARGWVVKPDDGAGAVDTVRYESFDAARNAECRRVQNGSPTTLEPWLEGEALSASLLCSTHSIEVLAINRQHIATDATGKVIYEGITLAAVDPRSPRGQGIADMAQRVACAIPGLKGFAGIDLVDVPGQGPVTIEVNPRITCAYAGLSQVLGRNVAAEIVDRRRAAALV